MENNNWFGECLKKELKKRNMTQTLLSDIMGVDPTVMHKWISGIHVPRKETIEDIMDILDCHIEFVPNK